MPSEEVTATDIARLAGVGRAAVSNWRKRHGDFPRPVGGPPTSPTFALPEIEAWLQANGKLLSDGESSRGSDRPGGSLGDVAAACAALLPAHPGLVLDPACGRGEMLAAASARFGAATAYVGQDADAGRIRLAREAVGGADLHVGSPLLDDALTRYRLAADAVVCMAPGKSGWQPDEPSLDLAWEFGAPNQLDPYLAWPQVCYAYLKPGGTAVVTVPGAAAVRASARRIRAEMLRAGALREVVALPEDAVPFASAPRQIWVLHRPADRPIYTVRMVDLAGAALPATERVWRAVHDDPERTADVESIELLDEDVLLVPSRHIEAPVRDVGPEYDKLRSRLSKASTGLDLELPAFRRQRDPRPVTMISITELVRQGALSFVDKATRLAPGDVFVPAGPDRFDASVLADPVPERISGDALRCETGALDPYFVACFLRSEANRRQASGTMGGTSRLDVRRARIPRLPLSEQRQYGEAFRRLTAIPDRIEAIGALAQEAVQTAVYGLTSGVMVPEPAAGTDRPGRPRTSSG